MDQKAMYKLSYGLFVLTAKFADPKSNDDSNEVIFPRP